MQLEHILQAHGLVGKGGGGGSAIELGNVMDLSIEAKLHGKMLIKWKDPVDIVLEGITLSKWGGTQLRRKLSTYPMDNKDGELVTDNKIRNQFENGYLDEGLVDGQKYYYALFPYTTTNTFTVDAANRISETAFEKYIQGKPDKPSVTGIGDLQAVVSSSVGSVVSLNQEGWHSSPHTFTGLTEDETYTPYAKFDGSEDYWESEITPGDSFIAINKLPQSPPPPPTISDLDFDKVTVTGVAGTEVKLDNGDWLDSPQTFTGLIAETEYEVFARMKETSAKFSSDSSVAKAFITPTEGDDPTGSPGSNRLIAGDMTAGYFGVVSSSELFTGDELSSLCGITQGVSQFSDEGWLKFAIDGDIIFKSKKPFRHSISWDHINSKGCVFGTKTVTKGDTNFKVTLMKGALTDPYLYSSADRGAKDSEWNRLMLPIHIQAKDKSWTYPAYVEDNIPYWGIDFTDIDLHTTSSAGSGAYQWGQETPSDHASRRVVRGGIGVSYSGRGASSGAGEACGFSPVLRVFG